MKYPESWEREVAGWVTDAGGDYIVTDEEDGPAVHRVKNINWLATARANWQKLALAVAGIAAVIGVITLLVKACRKK